MALSPGGRPINTSPLGSAPKDNWVEKNGGLPPYIRGVARGIAKSRGHVKPDSRDIATAIARMKVWAAGGGDVTPPVKAAAARAVAQWEALKGRAHADLSNVDLAFNPDQPRAADGRWADVPSLRFLHDDQRLASGGKVRLKSTDNVGSFLEELGAYAKSKPAGNFDLGKVRQQGTPLFTKGNKHIHRENMPQLSGVPLPGSKADKIPHGPGEEVDLVDQFKKELTAKGVKVTEERVRPESLKPTQDQLVGPKVAGIMEFMATASPDSGVFEPIFVTKDNYVIDGHHRWAANIGVDALKGRPFGSMKVRRVDLSIAEALKIADDFMDEWGLPRAGMENTSTVSTFAKPVDLAFDVNQPRAKDGRWSKAATRAWLGDHPPAAKNILDVWDQATPGERQTGKDWYSNAHKIALAMAKKNGVSVREAAGVIAAYSPQTPWGQNLINANEVLRTKKGVGGPGAHLDIVPTPDGFQDVHKGVMASGVNARRAEALLTGADFEEVFGGKRNKNGSLPPHSLKIRAFGELIANGGQSGDGQTNVVIDRHAAGVARGVRLTEDDYAIDGPSSSYSKFNAYAEAYREAAATLSKREGRKVTPEEVQATTWLTRQRLNAGSVKARNALGDMDNDNSLNYFASYDPNIADIVGHPMTGYAELATPAYLKDVDLTRYVRTPEGAEHFGLPIGSPIKADLPGSSPLKKAMNKARASMTTQRNAWPPNVERVALNGRTMTLSEARAMVGEAYSFEDRDREGGDGSETFEQSVDAQDKAQIVGKVWYNMTGGDASYDDQIAASLWQEYQSPDYYRSINEALRTGESNDDFAVSPGQMRLTVENMFEKGGYTIDKPMTVYRAMKSDDIDWAEKFKPGTYFTDAGIVSTTAHPRFAEGWLVGKADGISKRKTKPSDVVIEIRLPSGQRIVGGDPQFIETMLPPGTRLKVISAAQQRAKAVSPLTHKKNSFPYTHVIAEVAPSDQ